MRAVDFLQPDEAPLLVERRHPLSALDAWIGIAVLVLLVCAAAFLVAGFVTERAVPYSIAISIVAVLGGVLGAIAVAFRVRTSVNVVTAERVYHASGKLRFLLSQTTYDRVTDLHVHQGFFGRRIGFGNVLVQTAGQGVALVGIRDPLAAKRAIEEAREAMVRRLVADHRRKSPAAATAKSASAALADPLLAPRRAVGGPALWTAQPTMASVVGSVLPILVFAAPVLIFSVVGAGRTDGFSLIAPAVMAGFAILLLVAGIIRIRTTRFEVHGWGVAVSSGWIGRRRVEARYEKVTDVAVTQGVLGRVLGFGTIRINTAGGAQAPIAFDGVRDPDRVKAIVDRARQGGAP